MPQNRQASGLSFDFARFEMMKPTKRQTASYTMGYQDGNTGVKSKIDPNNNPHAAHAASTDYLTGYAVGKTAREARGESKK